MTQFNDFLSLISEAKKESEEKEQILSEKLQNNDFFNFLTNSEPLGEEFSEVLFDNLDDLYVVDPEPITEELIIEQPIIEKKTSALLDGSTYDKLFKTNVNLFDQPNLPKVNPELKALTDKIQYMENWLTKISMAGPGGGEVNFRYLDDVNRSTMNGSNDNWVLEYDANTKEVQFTENVGPIKTVKFNAAGYQTPLVPGQLGWNADEDCLDIKQNDGSTLQVGLEHYIRVHNHTANTMVNGTVVRFIGIENTNSVAMPICDKYIADGSITPLFLIGVLTNDLPSGGITRATTFGYVRDLNTTGSDVGETWAQGDLLWGHPTIAGKMTKVRPTAPNVATSIAAVVRVSTTDGQILVRPTIFPRLFFGDWYSTQNQVPATINTPYRITLNQSGNVSGFTNTNGLITAQNAGLYNFQFSLQVISSNSSAQYYWIWYRKNGQDVPNSATKLSISSNSIALAPSWNFSVSMQAGDTFELMWAADGLNVNLSALAATSFCPAIPSVILTVQQSNL